MQESGEFHATFWCNCTVLQCSNFSLYIALHAHTALPSPGMLSETEVDAMQHSPKQTLDMKTNSQKVLHGSKWAETVKMGCTCLGHECQRPLFFASPRCHGSAHDDSLHTKTLPCSACFLCIDPRLLLSTQAPAVGLLAYIVLLASFYALH